jgi:hypothetical protein
MAAGLALLIGFDRLAPDFHAEANTVLFNVLGYSFICCVASGLLAFTLGAETGWWMRLMTWQPIRWIGLVSYTGYLVHTGALALIVPFPSRALNHGLAFAVTIAYASLSWLFLERPILQLRPAAWLSNRDISSKMRQATPRRIAGWLAGGVLALLVLAAVATWVLARREVDHVSDEQKVARSLEIIRTSTPSDRKVLKVLFYGQSITRAGWDQAVVDHWHKQYPNTVFVVQNRALGGFASPMLLRTTAQDIAAFYPDLIIFHVYGDHRAYEQIIRLFRSQTAADIIVQTDHGESLPDPPCREGLRLTLHRPPGCTGLLWLKQRNWYDEMSYHKIPGIAKEYGLAVEPQRAWWREYLLRTHIEPAALLRDPIHPNQRGNDLIAAFFNHYFDGLVAGWNGQTEDHIESIPPGVPQYANGKETVSFDGSRLELISSKPLAAWPTVAIDGVASGDIDSCYQVTRASSTGTVPDWPAIRRITLQHDRVPEEWTATLTNFSADQSSFSFSVTSSVYGDEGSGDSAHDFVSKSGNLSIEAQDWMIERAFEEHHIPLQAPFAVHWSVNDVCAGTPEAIDKGDGTTEYRYVLGAGLANQRHTVTLSAPASDFADVTEFRAYRPPLHD